MIKINFTDKNGFNFERINAKKARAAYNFGLKVIFCASNMRPGWPWYPEIIIDNSDGATFEQKINAFKYYNCNAETGRNVNFFIPLETVDAFTGETPTEKTLHTVKQYNYKFLEV